MIKRARKSPCRCFIASRQVIPMVIVIHIVPGALYFFLFTMMWTLWGPGSRLLFWLGRLPTVQACRLFACPATRRPVHIKPWQKLVNQHHNAHHCNPSTVCRGFGPSRRPWSAWPFYLPGGSCCRPGVYSYAQRACSTHACASSVLPNQSL